MAAMAAVAAGIDRHNVPRGQGHLCGRPGAGGGGLAASRPDGASKIGFESLFGWSFAVYAFLAQ